MPDTEQEGVMEMYRVRTVRAPAGKDGYLAVIKDDASNEVFMVSWGISRLEAISEARRRLRRVKGPNARLRIIMADAASMAEEDGRARA